MNKPETTREPYFGAHSVKTKKLVSVNAYKLLKEIYNIKF